MRNSAALLLLALLFAVIHTRELHANGGAWPTGVPLTGNAAPSDKNRATTVAIEDEQLTIDLHQEFAAVEVRYRMKNTGAKVMQDFFFPVERWQAGGDSEIEEGKAPDLEGYSIKADNADLKWKTIDVPLPPKETEKETTAAETPTPGTDASDTESETTEEEETRIEPVRFPSDLPPPTKHWKKSEIPFAANQARDIVIRYRVAYSGYTHAVSDDAHETDPMLIYSLSPAATWQGAIGHGKIVVNVLHPRPEEVEIERPKDRFQKISDTRYEWEFRDLEPTLADDLRIIARRGYNSYDARNYSSSEEENQPWRSYVIQGDRYFLDHADYDAVASSTLPPSGKKKYDAANLRSNEGDVAWVEGVEGDGVGESVTLTITRPLPLDAILIKPGYVSSENPSLWMKNNRVAEVEVKLNDAHTFSAKIPDEKFEDAYPIVVRGYAEPVQTIKLTIKGVHRGTAARDTCISSIRLKAKLATKPKVQPAR